MTAQSSAYRVPVPPLDVALTLIAARIPNRLSFAVVSPVPDAAVHVLRVWPEDGVDPNTELTELSDHEVRTDILMIPAGVLSWSLCGLRFTIGGAARSGGIIDFDDSRLCARCLELLGNDSIQVFERG
jgi:hypothetical protein